MKDRRKKLLKLLYDAARERGPSSAWLDRSIAKDLGYDTDAEFEFDVKYLEDKGLIRTERASFDDPIGLMQITAYGIDAVESDTD